MAFRLTYLRTAFLVLVSFSLLAPSVWGADDISASIGRKISDFTLKDFRGQPHSLSDFKESKAVVVYFLGTECPLAKLYGPRLQKLADEMVDQKVSFIGISSNVQDSMTELAAHARRHQISFPILKDLENKIADRFGATRTPQVFVLDENRTVQYFGRIDAQFTFGAGVGLAQPQEQRHDLSLAVEELLAGKSVSVPTTQVRGCIIGRVLEPQVDSPVTYSNQIARIIQKNCVECHREGQIAPFAMTDYDEVAGWGEMIAEVVDEQRMPPWHANPEVGHFSNELRLTEKEKEDIYTWVDNGCPEGDRSELPVAKTFPEGWFLPRKPDDVFYLAEEPVDVKAEGIEPYRNYVVDPGFKEDKWVSLAECVPDNKSVVHHIIVFIRPKDEERRSKDPDVRGMRFLAGFAPGTRPMETPQGWAKKIPANSELVFQMHYTPIGTPQTDRSYIGLIYMDEKDVTHQLSTNGATNDKFEIPANDSNYKVESSRPIGHDSVMLSLYPHMHMRGKSFSYQLIYPNGTSIDLLDVPGYDFNWQYSYVFEKPLEIPQGSKLHCTAYFDNSEDNLANPDSTKPVFWGDQTWEEMMIGWYDLGYTVEVAKKIEEESRAREDVK